VWGWSQGGAEGSGLWIALLRFSLGIALPAFLAVLIGCIFVSWRFKLIAGTLILYVLILGRLLDLVYSIEGIWELLGSLIKLSFGLLGGLGAILTWNALKNKKRKKRPPKHVSADLAKGKRHPRISVFLLLLSLLSVPATYVAMFISAFVTIGLSALILIIVYFKLSQIPMLIIIASFLAPIVAIWATFRSIWMMFFPNTAFQSAVTLKNQTYPGLYTIIDDVCRRVKTKKPTAIILLAEPNFFVMKGKLATFDGVVKGRILALGMPLLKELNSLEISSILAHEFAHFSGRDTLYSVIVSPVYRGIISSMESLGAVNEESGDSSVSNITQVLLLTSQLFLGVFLEYFATIDMILSRNRELRADWIAANTYGDETFSSALKKVIRIGNHYNENILKIAIESDSNFFEIYSELLKKDKLKLHEYEKNALAEEEKEFDSHPTLTTRLDNLPDVRLQDVELQSITLKENMERELSVKENELAQKYTDQIKLHVKHHKQFYQYFGDINHAGPEDENHLNGDRELCPDESCIGIIENGKCTECGRET
jgi:Zn-dependent protease with chaperone function